jgi:hypothetical protein
MKIHRNSATGEFVTKAFADANPDTTVSESVAMPDPSGSWDFGQALHALRDGAAVQRAGWNGKGMFIYLVGPGRYAPTTWVGKGIAEAQPDGLVPYGPYVAMKTAQGDVVPWLASQTDLLAQDWGLYAEGSAAN